MELIITPGGTTRMVYQEEMNIAELGQISIQRASHVEPDEHGSWWADLTLVNGPTLGPFESRSDAVHAEVEWIIKRLASKLRIVP